MLYTTLQDFTLVDKTSLISKHIDLYCYILSKFRQLNYLKTGAGGMMTVIPVKQGIGNEVPRRLDARQRVYGKINAQF